MDTAITFAGHLAGDPELQHTRDGLPFAVLRGMVNRRTLTEAGEWVDAEPTAHKLRVFGNGAIHAHECLGCGDRVVACGVLETYAWADKDGEKRTRELVDVNDRFGEVGASLRGNLVRIEHAPALAAGAR